MNVSRLDYFAANAPEVPDWYANKFNSDGFVFSGSLDGLSPDEQARAIKAEYLILSSKRSADIYFSWRKYYSEQMVAMLPVQDVGGDQYQSEIEKIDEIERQASEQMKKPLSDEINSSPITLTEAIKEFANSAASMRPENCRNRLRDEGKHYPRSGCAHCKNGGLMGCPFEKVSAAQ